jgi:hypothetical protein
VFGDILYTFDPSNRDGLLLFFLWTLWAARSVVHKSTGLVLVLTQIEGADPVGAIIDGEDAVLAGRAKGDRLAAQRLADAPGAGALTPSIRPNAGC